LNAACATRIRSRGIKKMSCCSGRASANANARAPPRFFAHASTAPAAAPPETGAPAGGAATRLALGVAARAQPHARISLAAPANRQKQHPAAPPANFHGAGDQHAQTAAAAVRTTPNAHVLSKLDRLIATKFAARR